ncbi:hypothetical protein SOCE836_007250 [Sorangium cellulosum]|uniref:Uncharacterized protein n=1 Tax=Sorangium cellulosum TaxID=56 RepID=A0A4P2QGD9_SORCE|nr:hypothetical protein SOCE836_007250 [Sorangium cellulosum]WCQ88041.1 hypothetical protein NQZ70_00712 [Sorangium sp. Soce836]
MSYFYSVRGWLEVSPDIFSSITSTISTIRERWRDNEKAHLYMKGWCWSNDSINWTRYLFYGADVTEEGLTIFRSVINDLILLKADLSGYFHAQGEDGEKSIVFRIENDVLLEEARLGV